jgi:hypothetical protein
MSFLPSFEVGSHERLLLYKEFQVVSLRMNCTTVIERTERKQG